MVTVGGKRVCGSPGTQNRDLGGAMSLRADSETGNLPSLNRTKLQNNSQQRTSLVLRLLDLLSDFVYRLRGFFLKVYL